jgi:hypothetical protein
LRRLESELHDARDVYDAVGVFGTDIHDKLQVLHALKPVLPEALFFTSDLHAYYDYPRYMSFLRNLLVVTPHPLVPRVPISSTASKSIIASPFRSCYDNSVFLAVWHAVEPIEEHELRDLTRGMVFKVGNNGAVRIDRLAENRGLRDVWTFLLAWLAMPIIVLGVNYYLRRRRERDLGSIDGRRALHWSMVAAAPLAMWVALLLLLLFSSEPVSWGDGISVWPTEILRVLAFSLALVFAYHVSALFGFDKGHSRGKKSGRGKPSGHPSVCAALREWGFKSLHLHEFFDRQAKKASGEGSPKGTESDAQRARVLSALWCALAVFVGGLTLALVLGMPRVPTGDSRVWYFDRILTCGALFSTIWLVFLLVEAAQSFTQTCAWVQSRKRPKDPKRSLEFFEGRVRVLQQIRLLGGCGLYGPFFVVGLLVMSRWRVFDDWTWPWSLRIGLGLIGAAIVIAHICLHRAAISARRYLEDAIASDMINDDGSDFSRSARLKMLERSAKGLDGGIFAGPFSHPVTRALIIPFTGVGTLNLLQWLQAP